MSAPSPPPQLPGPVEPPPPPPPAQPRGGGEVFGIIGIVLGLLSLFFCGCLAPVGMLCSLGALRAEPKWLPWVGITLNALSMVVSLVLVVVVVLVLGGALLTALLPFLMIF